jgi:hypothetical protein
MSATTCPACQSPKVPRRYLCGGCWFTLTPGARRQLSRADGIPAARRLGELLDQIKAGVPLHTVVITR